MTNQRPRTVLLVEDNYDNRAIYTTILEYHGFAVLSAEDGNSGVEMAKQHHPDLIVMDVSIPGMNGWEATRTLKGSPDTAPIPILVLTAHAMSADRDRAFAEGANAYISKPADPTSVVNAVQRMLAGGT